MIFLSSAYYSTESQSESIAAEKLVGFHKKLQQINDFEPVRFLPVKSSSLLSEDKSPEELRQQQILNAIKSENDAIKNIADDDNIEYDQYQVHDAINKAPAPLIRDYNIRDSGQVPVYYANNNNNNLGHQEVATKSPEPYIPEHRIVHFDLKGAPPTIDYMKQVVTMSKNLGATGVLIEYEDMFPWSGR